MTVTWSDFEKEEESDNDNESKNFTTFMTSTVEVTKISSKALETEKSNELDSTVGPLEEESDEEDKSELQQAYDQLYKQSYKFTNINVKLSKMLKKAQEEVDFSKR